MCLLKAEYLEIQYHTTLVHQKRYLDTEKRKTPKSQTNIRIPKGIFSEKYDKRKRRLTESIHEEGEINREKMGHPWNYKNFL